MEGRGGRFVNFDILSTRLSSQKEKSLASFEIVSDSRPMFNHLDFILLQIRILEYLASVLMK